MYVHEVLSVNEALILHNKTKSRATSERSEARTFNVVSVLPLFADIFRPSIRKLGKFGAVIVTYLVSALLHGLNFQLAAVLLSLGFYTYVEFQLRTILADTFDACVASKHCTVQKCAHKYTAYNCSSVFAINLTFTGLSMFHLAYLGLTFDMSDLQETGYNYRHTIDKWAQLGFASHWVALATYCIYFLIK